MSVQITPQNASKELFDRTHNAPGNEQQIPYPLFGEPIKVKRTPAMAFYTPSSGRIYAPAKIPSALRLDLDAIIARDVAQDAWDALIARTKIPTDGQMDLYNKLNGLSPTTASLSEMRLLMRSDASQSVLSQFAIAVPSVRLAVLPFIPATDERGMPVLGAPAYFQREAASLRQELNGYINAHKEPLADLCERPESYAAKAIEDAIKLFEKAVSLAEKAESCARDALIADMDCRHASSLGEDTTNMEFKAERTRLKYDLAVCRLQQCLEGIRPCGDAGRMAALRERYDELLQNERSVDYAKKVRDMTKEVRELSSKAEALFEYLRPMMSLQDVGVFIEWKRQVEENIANEPDGLRRLYATKAMWDAIASTLRKGEEGLSEEARAHLSALQLSTHLLLRVQTDTEARIKDRKGAEKYFDKALDDVLADDASGN
jgi:tetratricopeptide (TPR) repeat protein